MLSARLETILNCIKETQVLADIGCDHGYLPIEAVLSKRVTRAYAMDVNQGPLSKAQKNIEGMGVVQEVTSLLSDGLANLPEDVDGVVIAGMGGRLIGSLLEKDHNKLGQIRELILSPHLDLPYVRRKVHQLGFRITEEVMIYDMDKYYTVIKAVPGQENYTDIEYNYGKLLMEGGSEVFVAYLNQQINKLELIREGLLSNETSTSKQRLYDLDLEICSYREVLNDAINRGGQSSFQNL